MKHASSPGCWDLNRSPTGAVPVDKWNSLMEIKTIKRTLPLIMPKPDPFSLTAAKNLAVDRSSIITNGIRIVRWVISRHGNIANRIL